MLTSTLPFWHARRERLGHRWHVGLLISSANAPSTSASFPHRMKKEALTKAIKQFQIEPARQNRITVTKISSRADD